MDYRRTPDEDRQAWFDLTSELYRAMNELGWNDLSHVPPPISSTAKRAARYYETWRFRNFAEEEISAIDGWLSNNRWPRMDADVTHALQLRLWTTIDYIEHLYVGPGRHGSTLIPFPMHVPYPNLLRWWLVDWFEDKGANLLFRHQLREWWSKGRRLLTPATAKRRQARDHNSGDADTQGDPP